MLEQNNFPSVRLGSYPPQDSVHFSTLIFVRSKIQILLPLYHFFALNYAVSFGIIFEIVGLAQSLNSSHNATDKSAVTQKRITTIVVIGEHTDIRQIGYYTDPRYRSFSRRTSCAPQIKRCRSSDIFQPFIGLLPYRNVQKKICFPLLYFLYF